MSAHSIPNFPPLPMVQGSFVLGMMDHRLHHQHTNTLPIGFLSFLLLPRFPNIHHPINKHCYHEYKNVRYFPKPTDASVNFFFAPGSMHKNAKSE